MVSCDVNRAIPHPLVDRTSFRLDYELGTGVLDGLCIQYPPFLCVFPACSSVVKLHELQSHVVVKLQQDWSKDAGACITT